MQRASCVSPTVVFGLLGAFVLSHPDGMSESTSRASRAWASSLEPGPERAAPAPLAGSDRPGASAPKAVNATAHQATHRRAFRAAALAHLRSFLHSIKAEPPPTW